MTCLLLGTPAFAIPAAEALFRNSACALVGVVTRPDAEVGRRPRINRQRANDASGLVGPGRVGERVGAEGVRGGTEGVPHDFLTPPPLKVWAVERGIRVWQPKTKAELTAVLRELQPDVAVVVAYGKIIPPEALAVPRSGFVNVHPSLLPRWRGPSPIAAALANGDAETGVSLMLLDAEVDHGPLIAQERVVIPPDATRSTLEHTLAEHGATLLGRILPEYLAGHITPKPQDHAAATHAKMLTRDDGRIDWREPAAVIERKIRAYEGWPGTWCLLPNEKRLKVLHASIGAPTAALPGTVIDGDARFAVACGDRRLLMLTRVQPEGGVVMDAGNFLRGQRGLAVLPVRIAEPPT